jgi:phospholipase C
MSIQSLDHIVVLMLENRSFDQMLGFLYPGNKSDAGDPFDGLTGKETNPDGLGGTVSVYAIKESDPHRYAMPGADPGEGYYNTNQQLFSTQHADLHALPQNQGFITNFRDAIASDTSHGYSDTLPNTQPSQIMGMYTPALLPVMSALAKGYAVCDRWFAAVPTQTIPNRAFVGAGTSQGRLDNHVKTFTCPSIFGRLSDRGEDWAIYGYDRSPMTRLDFPDTTHAAKSKFGKFKDFVKRAAAGQLPAYTFLEPSFGQKGNSQHPNYDVAAGEQLIHDVYYALRKNTAAWQHTLLVITYDEHGGNYDHVKPPYGAVPPDDTVGEFDNFDFRRFGVRVPALLISPLIKAGTVFRPADAIDHTAILKTIQERWGTERLTARVDAMPSLSGVLTLAKARTDDPLEGVRPPTSASAANRSD